MKKLDKILVEIDKSYTQTMGLIKEPKNVEFTVLDKQWTVEERKEFSAFIKLRKEKRKKQNAKKIA